MVAAKNEVMDNGSGACNNGDREVPPDSRCPVAKHDQDPDYVIPRSGSRLEGFH